MPLNKSSLCACGSKKDYTLCCADYIANKKNPPTAEALMRSRYTAYTQANITYIKATMCGKAAMNFNPVAAEEWAKTAKWQRLKVVNTAPQASDDNYYYVEFIAHYLYKGRKEKIHEISQFKRLDGRWYYVGC